MREYLSTGCGQKEVVHLTTLRGMSTPAPESPTPPYRITVVCLGNICRSPIGEAVLRRQVAAAGLDHLVTVDSAGTGDWHIGHDADPRARATLADHGYELSHSARQIDPSWFEGIDLVLAMDGANYTDLQVLIQESGAGVVLRMLRSYDPGLRNLTMPDPALNVPDPYTGGASDFIEVLHMVERAGAGLVAGLPEQLRHR
jgi:protein-tyrosine phosphatase